MVISVASLLPQSGTNYVVLFIFIAVPVLAACALIALALRSRHQGQRVSDLEQRISASDRPPTD